MAVLRRIAGAFVLLAFSQHAFATAAVFEEVASSIDTSLNTSASSGSFASACPTGATVEAYVLAVGNATPSSVADSADQAYTLRTSIYDSNSNLTFALYTLANNQSATTLSVTATWAASTYNNGVWAKCLTGVTAAAYQTSIANYQINPGTAANAITSTALTPSEQPALLSAVSASGGGNALTAGSGFTAGTIGFSVQALSESVLLMSTSAIPATYTDATDGDSRDYLTIAAVYTSASTPPPVSYSQFFLGAKLPMPHPAGLALALPAWIIERQRKLARRS